MNRNAFFHEKHGSDKLREMRGIVVYRKKVGLEIGGDGMIIQHNLLAQNADRQFGFNHKLKGTWMERLSSGYRINRAADDAAGLAISEEMRGQIRGLNRAADNVLEGIHLIRTADGAMSEQVEMLQRLREITIQSYNDSYTQDDRLKIQYEAEALLSEMNRLSTDTEYNTIKILQGNPVRVWTTTKTIEPSEAVSDVPVYTKQENQFPDWVSYGESLSKPVGKAQRTKTLKDGTEIPITINVKQDTSQYVAFNQNKRDDDFPYQYAYGPDDQYNAKTDGTYMREWTDKLDDNYLTTVDFSALAEEKTQTGLLEKVKSLIGTGIGYGCYSCAKIQGVCFDSPPDIVVEEIENVDEASRNFQRVDLHDYVDMAENLIGKAEFEGLKGADPASLTDEEYLRYSQTLEYTNYAEYSAAFKEKYKAKYTDFPDTVSVESMSRYIAQKLVKDIIDKTDFKDNHFVRTAINKPNQYEVIFYDLRDEESFDLTKKEKYDDSVPYDKTEVEFSGAKVLDKAVMRIRTMVQVENEPYVTTTTHRSQNGLWIQAGANTNQKIILNLANTSLSALGLVDYNVFREGYCSGTPDKKWDSALMGELTKTGAHTYSGKVGGTKVTSTQHIHEEYETEIAITELVTEPGGTNRYGETVKPRTYMKVVGKQKVPVKKDYELTTTKVIGGKQVTVTGYPPDDILRVDRAIRILTNERVKLGAVENRLEHAWLYDENAAENLQAAESKIRDTDYAKAMVENAKLAILEQAGFSMIAQANESTSGVLKLLGSI